MSSTSSSRLTHLLGFIKKCGFPTTAKDASSRPKRRTLSSPVAQWRDARIALLASFSLLILTATGPACKKSSAGSPPMSLQSPSFHQGDTIPRQFTCDGPNVSPALSWSTPPANTQSLAFIINDPDAPSGTFTHWVLYNLPPQPPALPEGIPTKDQLPDGSRQGQNDNDSTGYW